MKLKSFTILTIITLFVTIFSCSNKSNKRPRKPVSNITIQPEKQQYVWGEKVSVNVSTKLRDGELKSVNLSLQNNLIEESKELDFTAKSVEIKELGTVSFNVSAEKTDGLKNTRSKTITVLSDIKPAQFSYQVLNNYPHLTTSYTQGLEYYNGYFYEGTGERGHSKLMKVDISTGKPLKVFEMDDKYFGEGITILNGKIYQLTYKAQKGFVYDLETLAVIDSFTYASTEGWGLTNDGKNLIMSDGTNYLTWLDPEDFSVVKKLQVADDRVLMTYLNELEYVNGFIYANIYQTNYIVKVDLTTGKILEEINLGGIIDLYHKPGERIDFLNGIAYDSENNRMYVTGKLYPRLFEVKFISK
ncbi:MAG: glutaminyl-peptide cyclotransferase [Draconibacterium sp.]